MNPYLLIIFNHCERYIQCDEGTGPTDACTAVDRDGTGVVDQVEEADILETTSSGQWPHQDTDDEIDGLVQERCNSIANALSNINPSKK